MLTKAVRKSAEQDLSAKLKLEDTFKRDIRSVFSHMVNDFRVQIASTGTFGRATTYLGAWETIVRTQYRRVQKFFSGRMLDDEGKNILLITVLRKQGEEGQEEDAAILALALQQYRDERAPEQSQLITETNDKQMLDAVNEARRDLIDRGEPIDNRTVSTLAAVLLARKFKPRVDLIAMTETQNASEATKAIEAGLATGQPSNIVRLPRRPVQQPRQAIKSWATMGDSKVRDTHRAANGQTIPVDQPFQVGNSLLMFPGDMSLGADPKEIYNCRCSAVYQLV